MKIKHCVLNYLLESRYQIIDRGKSGQKKSFSHIEFYSGADSADDALLITFDQGISSESVLCITDEEITNDGWFLSCPKGQKMPALNYVMRTFAEYCSWNAEMEYLSVVKHDWHQILEASTSFLQEEILLFDRELNFYFANARIMKAFYNYFTADYHKQKDQAMLEMYEQDPDFDRTWNTRGIQEYTFPSLIEDYKELYCNLMLAEQYFGRMLAEYPQGRNKAGAVELNEMLYHWISHCLPYMNQNTDYLNRKKTVKKIMSDVLSGDQMNNKNIDTVRAFFPVDTHLFQVFVFRSAGYMHSDQALFPAISQLEILSPKGIALNHHNDILLLLPYQSVKQQYSSEKYSVFIRDNLLKMGISQEFSDLNQLYLYYQEACTAIEIGEKIRPEHWYYLFSDYVTDFVLNESCRKFPGTDLCPTSVKLLRQYDNEHKDSELTKTLECYIKARYNGSKAADLLYIHKTTFFYRLNKIQELTGIDFDSPRQMLGLMLYFCISDIHT